MVDHEINSTCICLRCNTCVYILILMGEDFSVDFVELAGPRPSFIQLLFGGHHRKQLMAIILYDKCHHVYIQYTETSICNTCIMYL